MLPTCNHTRMAALVVALAACHGGPDDGGSELPPADGELGERAQAIIGGQVSSGDPAVAALIFTYEGGRTALCTGTLIAPDVVLTAAHCLDGQEPLSRTAYFGTTPFGRDDDAIAEIDIVDFTYDIGFDIDNLEAGHDIGMVRLASPVPAVDPVPLNYMPTTAMMGQSIRLAGFGRTEPIPADPDQDDGGGAGIKRQTVSTIRPYSEVFPTGGDPPDLVAYGQAGEATCQGDSGGPNFVTVDGVEYVAGITSFGDEGCTAAAGTRVDRYTSYITSYVDNGGAACIDDGICESSCLTPDPDCAATQCGADGTCQRACGARDPDCVASARVVGGCSAAARGGPPAAMALLLALAAVGLRRRRGRAPTP